MAIGAGMADFIRPELTAQLRRHRDLLGALVLVALGLWAALGALGILRWLGYAVALAGLALAWTALQRLRFRPMGAGPGVVQVVEGEIRYFGPETGAFIALQDMDALSLSSDGRLWLIDTMDRQRHALPRAAQGAESLFDAFASLPGLAIEPVLRATARAPTERAQRLWTRPQAGALPRS